MPRASLAIALLLLAPGSLVARQGAQENARQGAQQNTQQPPAPAAQAPAPRESGQTLRVPVNLVNIIATVLTRREKLVTDLEQPEFRVFEDGQEQKIAFFSRETDLPLRIGLLLDTSNSIRERLEFERMPPSSFSATPSAGRRTRPS